ncbi:MAG: helix-turn-helix domain-containing protein [Proteobacteria bacterium]|nr:helix-turn-helix domain-containing protein [Pseudomonadota bacterium]
MQNKEKIWTEEMVIHAFEEAIRTLKKLPTAKLRDYFTSWPQVVYSEIEILRMDQRPKKWPATPEAISRMEKACGWILLLKEIEERKIIWLRAKRTPWKLICGELGFSRATANRKWKSAIRQITLLLD